MNKMTPKNLLIVVFILIIPTLLPLFKPGFFSTHDYVNVARIEQLDAALKEGHFPTRWAPDIRYGEPLFNFYAPLPYYVGALINILGFNFLTTAKILFGLSLVLSAVFMYFFAKEIFGRVGALVSTVLYTYAPYRAVDIYVRGALSEAWVFVFMPLIFLFAYKLATGEKRVYAVYLSLSLAGLFLTHNITTLILSPFIVGWFLLCIYLFRKFNLIKWYALSGFLGAGLASFYLLPAFFERELVQIYRLTTGYFDFRAHFVALGQLFSTFWGYGASTWGVEDGFSFQLGAVHWLVIAISLVTLAIFIRKLKKQQVFWFSFFVLSFLLSLFMQHNKSTFIWEAIPILAFVQFPWRFLGISIFFTSLIGGLLISFFGKKGFLPALAIVGALVLLNFRYFRPEEYFHDFIDEDYVSHEQILWGNDKTPKDYLPVGVEKLSEERILEPIVRGGDADIYEFEKRAVRASFEVEAKEQSFIEVPITYFPGWEFRLNEEVRSIEEPSDLGLILIRIPEGRHRVELKFKDTPIRITGNLLTFSSLVTLTLLFIKLKNGKKSKIFSIYS